MIVIAKILKNNDNYAKEIKIKCKIKKLYIFKNF